MIPVPKTAIIPAAGFGNRLKPVTSAIPKEMFPIGRFPAIEWVIADAVRSGCRNIIIITRPGKEVIEDYIINHRGEILRYCDVRFVRQPEPLGLGHAVMLAEEYILEDRFALLLPDNLIDAEEQPIKSLTDYWSSKNGCIISVMEGWNVLALRISILRLTKIRSEYYKITRINQPEIENTDNNVPNLLEIGRSILNRDFLEAAKELQKKHISDEMTGGMVLNKIIDKGIEVNALKVSGKCFDISTVEGYIAAWQRFGTSEPLWQ